MKPRRRWAVALALGATIALGLLSRRHALPGLLAEHTGDALYASAVFFGLALLWPAARAVPLAVAAAALAFAVEFSQLLDWPWLVEIRRHRFGALVLGQGFVWLDLVSYLVGAIGAAVLDAGCRKAASRAGNKTAGGGTATGGSR